MTQRKISNQKITPIYDIQGEFGNAKNDGKPVVTRGVVIRPKNSEWARTLIIQGDPDGNPKTPDGIALRFPDTVKQLPVQKGDLVEVRGTIDDYVGQSRWNKYDLPQKVILCDDANSVSVVSHRSPLPVPVEIGEGGLIPPIDLQQNIAFWKSLDGTRVHVKRAGVVGASASALPENVKVERRFGANIVYVVPETQTIRVGLGRRGACIYMPHQMVARPFAVRVNGSYRVGDVLEDITGVVRYKSSRFEIVAEGPAKESRTTDSPSVTSLVGSNTQVVVASVNLHNLNLSSGTRMAAIAKQIGVNLKSPDVVGLQEVQDDDETPGSQNLSSERLLRALEDEIFKQSGVRYAHRYVSPSKANTSGGAIGGNIRVACLYRTDRLEVDDASIKSIGEGDPAFRLARKSLLVGFRFKPLQKPFSVIVNHLTSKMGSTPKHGTAQPPANGGAEKRLKQVKVVEKEIDSLLSKKAAFAVLGDFNANHFEPAMQHLAKKLRNVTWDSVAPDLRFSHVFEGLAELLDHILVPPGLKAEAEILHLNSELPDAEQPTDHDVVISRIDLSDANAAAARPSTRATTTDSTATALRRTIGRKVAA